jgi:hypothetical protein
MGEFFQIAWERFSAIPGEVWMWFGRLNREEWMVTLAVVCAIGFASLMAFRTRQI